MSLFKPTTPFFDHKSRPTRGVHET